MNRPFCLLPVLTFVFLFASIAAADEKLNNVYGDSVCPAKIINSQGLFSLTVRSDGLYGIRRTSDHEGIYNYSSSGDLIDSISLDSLHRTGSAEVPGKAHHMAFDNDGNIWIMTQKSALVIDKKRKIKIIDLSPKTNYSGRISTGNRNEVVIFNANGANCTSDMGQSWILIKGAVPENPQHRAKYNDYKLYDFLQANVESAFYDKNGRSWTGSSFGLIYSDDNLQSWHSYYDSTSNDHSLSFIGASVLGSNSKGDIFVWAREYSRFYVKNIGHEFSMLVDSLRSRYPNNYQHHMTRGEITLPSLSSDYLIYVDANFHYISGEPALKKEWLESVVVISDNSGKSWKEYKFGKGLGISEMAVVGKSLFVASSRGLLMIPLECFK